MRPKVKINPSDAAWKWGGFGGACCLGAFIVFLNRFAIGSDQATYLDLASNLARGSWLGNVSAYWGALMPALVAMAYRLVHPSIAGELPVADGMLFFTFVFVLVAQLFFQARLAGLLAARFPGQWSRGKRVSFPSSAWRRRSVRRAAWRAPASFPICFSPDFS